MKTNLNALKNSSCKLGVEAQPPNEKLNKNLEVFFLILMNDFL